MPYAEAVKPTEKTINDYLKQLKNTSVHSRMAAAWGLSRAENITKLDKPQIEQVVNTLKDILSNEKNADIRRNAAVALGSLGEKAISAATALRDALEDKSPDVRKYATWALGNIGDKFALPFLVNGVNNENETTDVRRYAVEAVGKLASNKDRYAVETLDALAKQENLENNLQKEVQKVLTKLKSV